MTEGPILPNIIERAKFIEDKEALNHNLVVVKLSSNITTNDDGTPNIEMLEHVSNQISVLREQKIQVIVVASGAIASGEPIVNNWMMNEGINDIGQLLGVDASKDGDPPVLYNQMCAAFGQPKMMDVFLKLLEDRGMPAAQILLHHEKRSNLPKLLHLLSLVGVVIVNANDPVYADSEEREVVEKDNDEQTDEVARMTNAGHILMLGETNGVLDSNDQTIPWINSHRLNISTTIIRAKSKKGRGGMRSKLKVMIGLARTGRRVAYAQATTERDTILDFAYGIPVGTRVSNDKIDGYPDNPVN